MSESNRGDIALMLSQPFYDDNFSGSDLSAVTNDDAMMMAGGVVVQKIFARIPDAISAYKAFITIEALLWAAKVAFDFGISRLPFPVPSSMRDQLWTTLEGLIRGFWSSQSELTTGEAAPG